MLGRYARVAQFGRRSPERTFKGFIEGAEVISGNNSNVGSNPTSRTMTRKQKDLEEKKKHEFLQMLIQLSQQLEFNYIEFGKQLKTCRDDTIFDPEYDTFPAFLQEMKLTQGTASKLINIYEKFVVEYGIPIEKLAQAGGWSVVAEILPVVANKAKAKEWVEKAIKMRRKDLRKEVKEEKTGVSMASCLHKDFYLLQICRVCGDSFKKV